MLKTILFLTYIGLLSVPNVESQAVDWTAVENSVNQIGNVVNATFAFVKMEAMAGGPAVASLISQLINSVTPAAAQIFNQLSSGAATQTLTTDQVNGYIAQLQSVFTDLITRLQNYAAQLPDPIEASLITLITQTAQFVDNALVTLIQQLTGQSGK